MGEARVWDSGLYSFDDYPTRLKNETLLSVKFSPDETRIAAGIRGTVRVETLGSSQFTDFPYLENSKLPAIIFKKILELRFNSMLAVCQTYEPCHIKRYRPAVLHLHYESNKPLPGNPNILKTD